MNYKITSILFSLLTIGCFNVGAQVGTVGGGPGVLMQAVYDTVWSTSGSKFDYSGNTTDSAFIGTKTAHPFIIKTNSLERLRISDEGKLILKNPWGHQYGSFNYGTIISGSFPTYDNALYIKSPNSIKFHAGIYDVLSLSWSGIGSSVMGHVKIGDDLPADLEVNGMITSTSGGIKFPDNSTQFSASPWKMQSSNIITTTAGANVGIGEFYGSTMPTVFFSLKKSSAGTPIGITQGHLGGASTMEFTTDDGLGQQTTRMLIKGNTANADIEFYSGSRGIEKQTMIIKNNTVGIGLNNPYARLHVHTNGGAYGYTFISQVNNKDSKAIAVLNGNDENFVVMGDGRVFIKGNGKLGIGTTNIPADAEMAVDGIIYAEGIEVQMSGDWPDYVFEKNYPLMPLNLLEGLINQNKHLPGIPSAQQIKEEGFNVAKMDALLLQKIEELTLHMIQLNKEIENLKFQVK